MRRDEEAGVAGEREETRAQDMMARDEERES
jgi:hypothetical protein